MIETPENRLKRMRLRSWRRGTKEMDIVLGTYADAHLAAMSPDDLEAFEALLAEQDQDLMRWVFGETPPPPEHAALIAELTRFAKSRYTPSI